MWSQVLAVLLEHIMEDDKASIVGLPAPGGNAKFNTESQTYARANFLINAFLLKKNKVVF